MPWSFMKATGSSFSQGVRALAARPWPRTSRGLSHGASRRVETAPRGPESSSTTLGPRGCGSCPAGPRGRVGAGSPTLMGGPASPPPPPPPPLGRACGAVRAPFACRDGGHPSRRASERRQRHRRLPGLGALMSTTMNPSTRRSRRKFRLDPAWELAEQPICALSTSGGSLRSGSPAWTDVARRYPRRRFHAPRGGCLQGRALAGPDR